MKKYQLPKLLFIIVTILFSLLSIVMLTYPAIFNGYPLLYTDSATYIVSGHDGTVPIDRPIFYGLFVRYISISFSLWFVVLIQAIFVIALIFYTFKLFFQSQESVIFSFITILILSALTGLPNYVSQIMPDIFTGIMIWTIILFFFSKSRIARSILLLAILFSAAVHNSNLMTLTLMVLLILPGVFIFKLNQMRKQLYVLMIWVISIWLIVPTVNYYFAKEWYVSKSGSIFLIGKMIQTGVVKDYLDEECVNNNYELCLFKDSLPQYSYEFYWNGDSPLYYGDCGKELGWTNCWKVKSAEYKKIIWGVLSKPDLFFKYAKISVIDAFKQMVYFDMIHYTKLGGQGSAFDSLIKQYFDDYPMFAKSKQYNEQIFFNFRNKIQRIAIALSALIVIFLLFIKGFKKSYFSNTATLMLILGLMINAALCSTFSIVEGRFQGRIIWLITLLCCIFAAFYFNQKKSKNELVD